MVLEQPPQRPVQWQYKQPSAEQSTTSVQSSLCQYFSSIKTTATQTLAHQKNSFSSLEQRDDEILWSAPQKLTLCRKGFVIDRSLDANKDFCRRALRDLTMDYPESNFERNRRKMQEQQFWGKKVRPKASKPPLHVFSCTLDKLKNNGEVDVSALCDKGDWSLCIQHGEDYRKRKMQRALEANHLLLPKFFVLEQLKGRANVTFDDKNYCGEQMNSDVHFHPKFTLVETKRRPQQTACRFAINNLNKTGGAVLVLPVGCGKTVCALWIAMHFRMRTLIVVGTENLIDQWHERIAQFCPNAKVGSIQGSVCDVDGKDFVIACTKSLTQNYYDPAKLATIGMTIYDEAHHAAAKTIVEALFQSASPLMLALTADPTREDGMTNVLYYFFSFNVHVVLPSLPPGIELHVLQHRLNRRCFIQDANCVPANRLTDRRKNCQGDAEKLAICEALASFDKRHYGKAQLSSAKLLQELGGENSDWQAQLNVDCQNLQDTPKLVKLQAHSEWQRQFAQDDVSHLNYTQTYQQLQCDAHRNATIVAYVKQLLNTNCVDQITMPTIQECNDTSTTNIFDCDRFEVQVECDDGARMPISAVEDAGIRNFKQCERQVLVLTSEQKHVDALVDKLVNQGVPREMIGVYMGGATSATKKRDVRKAQRQAILSRRVIVATYAMAAEGTDISTLNSIIFAVPRSSITDQAIGRGLRDKMCSAIMPIIVDLCDQWCVMTQKMFYKRNKSYRYYNAHKHVFEDYSSFEATGTVRWKKVKATKRKLVKSAATTKSRKRKRTTKKDQPNNDTISADTAQQNV